MMLSIVTIIWIRGLQGECCFLWKGSSAQSPGISGVPGLVQSAWLLTLGIHAHRWDLRMITLGTSFQVACRDRNSPLETKEPIVYHQVAHRLYSRPIQATTLLTQDNPESDRILFCHIVKSTYLCFPDSRLALNLYIKIMINIAFKHSMFALVTFPVAMVKYSDTYCSLRGSPSRWGRKFEAVGFFL